MACAKASLETGGRLRLPGLRRFHQHVPGGGRGQRIAGAVDMAQHQLQRHARDQLESRQHAARSRACICAQKLQRGGGRGHGGKGGDRDIGFGKQFQGRRGDHAQGAFRADEHLLEVVAAIVLVQDAHHLQHRAVGQHHFQAQHQGAGHAIAHDMGAAGIGGDVAANGATAFRRQADRGNRKFSASAAACTCARVTPASTVRVMPLLSSARMRFSRLVDSSTSPC